MDEWMDGLVWMQNFIDNFQESWDNKTKREDENSADYVAS